VGEPGLNAPDVVAAGSEWTAEVTGINNPVEATCTLYELTGDTPDQPIGAPGLGWEDGTLQARAYTGSPGLYRLELDGASTSPVSQIVMATPPE
jgi:hypothetical protein